MEVDTATTASSSGSTESPETSASAPPVSKKRPKITDHFVLSEDTFMEKRISRMVAKDGLPFRVFCTSEDIRDLFNSSGQKLPKSPNTLNYHSREISKLPRSREIDFHNLARSRPILNLARLHSLQVTP
ncbi:hypothetical protein O0L34_g10729 [Tuta absoluta]|nr:hypothetical protein O0L34_g10729 [Tuta absoluta]